LNSHFVLAVRCNQYMWPDMSDQMTVEQLAATVAPPDWTDLAGERWRQGAPFI
jgi:hypothetical protein